jgi:hypothetical protein
VSLGEGFGFEEFVLLVGVLGPRFVSLGRPFTSEGFVIGYAPGPG